MMKINIFRKITRPWCRWRARIFLHKFRKMLLKFDQKLKAADYNRHERRRIKRGILKDIKTALDTYLKEE